VWTFFFETAAQDLRFALRTLWKSPGFTAVAVLTLALGIGANTAIFSLFDGLLLQSLPVREPGRLVLFSDELSEGTYTGNAPTGAWPWFSFEFYEFLRKQTLPLESVCAFRMGQSAVSLRFASDQPGAQPKRASEHLVSGNYFETLGVEPALGRMLQASDDQRSAPPVAVISYLYWARNLSSDPAAIGKVAILNGTAFTIVGVAPPEFFGERVRHPPDYWLPLAFQPQMEPYNYLDDANAYGLNLMGRLQPGATRAQAQSAVTLALQEFLRNKAGAHVTPQRARLIAGSHIQLHDGSGGLSQLRFAYSQPLHVLLAVAAMVLLIASANVASLLLARGASRRGEIGVRLALGASSGRLVRQLLTESLVLATLGAACAALLARWAIKAAASYVAGDSPQQPHLNAAVMFFTIGIALVAGILFGLAPALQSGRMDLVSALKTGETRGSGRSHTLRSTKGVVIAQLGASLVLLVGASLFARSLLNLEHLQLGFDPQNVLLARVNPRIAGYKPQNVGVLYRALIERISELPGVRAATIAYYSPLSGSKSTNNISVAGYQAKPGENLEAETIPVVANYSEALSIPVVLGRELGLKDTLAAPKVAMVNEAFVRRFFPSENPIGRRVAIDQIDYEIVGVLKDAHFQGAREKQAPVVFPSLLQDETPDSLRGELAVRTSGGLQGTAVAIRDAVAQVDPALPITGMQSLRDQVDANYDRERLAARFVSGFSGLALLLACVGLYGAVAQGVAGRRAEIGLRMALGAQRSQVLWLVLRDTAAMFLGGLAVGIPAAWAASKLISSQLFGLRPGDAASFATAIAVLALVSALAAFLPARRAAQVDPIVALRQE
jgi:predicted permease